jgi:hypothetical protein
VKTLRGGMRDHITQTQGSCWLCFEGQRASRPQTSKLRASRSSAT